MRPPLLLLALTASVPSADPGDATRSTAAASSLWAQVQASTGAELDTNARRAISGDTERVIGPGRAVEKVADGLLRLLLDVQAGLRIGPRHKIYTAYILGGKRFLNEGSEDLLSHSLTLGSRHDLGRHVDLGISGWFKASRMRSQRRDYNLGVATAQLGVQLGAHVRLDVGGDVRSFHFDLEPRFDYWGPRGSLRVTWTPSARLSFFTRGAIAHRRYQGFALVNGELPSGETAPVFCDGSVNEGSYACVPVGPRQDIEGQGEVGGRVRAGPLLLRAGYVLRVQRSTGNLQDVNRHRVYAQATWALPFFGLTSNLMATLQINDGVSPEQREFIVAEDDENQNSVRIQVRKALDESLDAELNYALFANQFSTASVSFLRQTVSLGLRVHFDDTQGL